MVRNYKRKPKDIKTIDIKKVDNQLTHAMQGTFINKLTTWH